VTDVFAAAPLPSHRLIPSKFPPIGLFDTVATAADLQAVMELAGWTNDRLVLERIKRLPEAEWVYGTPNASIVMAAFLHVAPGGMRFNGAELGAWYAANTINTCIAEVAHHLRREIFARGRPGARRTYRQYLSTLLGDYLDISGQQRLRPDIYDRTSYVASQLFGESLRASASAGILYDSLRLAGGINVVALRPRNIVDIVQGGHFEISVTAAERRIAVKTLGSGNGP
jgi:hypothetical protein